MSMKIALAGNPNSGKTTMFNDLTGSSQYVGNWPGVTVEKKEGKLKGNKDVVVQDLPGIYSLSPYTLEEVVSRNYLIREKPDAIINIVDATNIERNLYLTTQLTEIGVPVVMALNMIDIVRKRGDAIDLKKLGEALGCEVIETSALKGIGLKEAAQKAIEIANSKSTPQHTFASDVEEALDKIAGILSGTGIQENLRWYAIKVFERDAEALKDLSLSDTVNEQIEEAITACEEAHDDDSESIITNERYNYITGVVKSAVKVKNKTKVSGSDKIDRIVTNRILALPIFAAIMFMVYFLSITTVGTAMTDWVNESLFEEGWFVLGIGSGEFGDDMEEFEVAGEVIGAFLEEAEESGVAEAGVLAELLEVEPEDYAAGEDAYEDLFDTTLAAFVENPEVGGLVAEAEILDEDHELVEVLSVGLAEFEEALAVEEPDPSEYGPFVPGLMEAAETGLEGIGTADWLVSLIVDGIIAGVGAVLGFLPQMLVLFFCLAILEDCGYMARIAFIMDRIFRKFGLSGKSFIPILIGTGCGVPGIMASRTIENEADRRMTIITTTFIPCGAKLPIISLIAGAVLGGSAWVATSAYFLGIAAIVFSGIILKKFKAFAGKPAPFVMELPAYHVPGLKGVLIHMWDRGKAFVKKAGSIILLATILIWFLSSFNFSMEMVDADQSILAAIGSLIAPLFAPLGWGDWRAAVATFTGLIAKENVVGTFGVLYGFGEVMEDGYEIWGTLQAAFAPLAAYSFLVFNLLCAPCFAAIGAVRREMMSAKWTWFAIGYQCALAYAVSLIIYQIGMAITTGFSFGTVVAILLVVLMIWLLFRKKYEPDRTIKTTQTQKAVH